MTPFDRWQVEAGLSVLSDEELIAGWWQCAACARVNHPGEGCTCDTVGVDASE